MKKTLLLVAFAASLLLGSCTGKRIPANNEFIEYSGRIDFSDPLAPEFSFSGVSIRAAFKGTSISAILSDDLGQNYYNILIDNSLYKIVNVKTGVNTYLLAEGLSNTIHEIEIFKRTELTFGKTQFYGFILDEGASIELLIDKRKQVIEFIGNSITCGYGNEGGLNDDFVPETENHFLSYAAITSRNFNAQIMAVSRSGIGIYRNYNGPVTGNADCMTNLYTRTFLYDEQPLYDFAEKPDVICINLGTNDFSTSGADSALYVSNYFRLIDTIQTKYHMPEIVCLLGPMMNGSSLDAARKYIKFIADSTNSKKKGNVSFFEMSTQGSLGYAVHYHPTLAQHSKNAMELTEYLQTLMNWKLNPLITEVKRLDNKQIQLKFNTPVYDPTGNYSGFSIIKDGFENSIKEIKHDKNNHAIINISLEESISDAENLFLQYLPGTIESEESVKMLRIGNMPIKNILNSQAN